MIWFQEQTKTLHRLGVCQPKKERRERQTETERESDRDREKRQEKRKEIYFCRQKARKLMNKEVQTQKGSNKKALIYLNTDTQYANFRGNPLYEATKRTTYKRLKTMKNERKRLILSWLSFCSLFGAWKIVGMNKEEKKKDRERKRAGRWLGGGGGGGKGFVINMSLPLSR